MREADDQWVIRGVLQTANEEAWISSAEILGVVGDATLRENRLASFPDYPSSDGGRQFAVWVEEWWQRIHLRMAPQAFRVVESMLRIGLIDVGDVMPFETWDIDLEYKLARLREIENILPEGYNGGYWFGLEITQKGKREYENRVKRIACKLVLAQGMSVPLSLGVVEVMYRIAMYGFDEDEGELMHQDLLKYPRISQTQVRDSINSRRDVWWESNRENTIMGSIAVLNNLIDQSLISVEGDGGELEEIVAFDPMCSTLLEWQVKASGSYRIRLTERGMALGARFMEEPMKDRIDFMTSD